MVVDTTNISVVIGETDIHNGRPTRDHGVFKFKDGIISTSKLETLGLIASFSAANLNQDNHDRKNKLENRINWINISCVS